MSFFSSSIVIIDRAFPQQCMVNGKEANQLEIRAKTSFEPSREPSRDEDGYYIYTVDGSTRYR